MTTIDNIIDACLFRTRFINKGKYDTAFIAPALAGNSDFHTVDPMRWADTNAARAAAVYGFLAHRGQYSFPGWSSLVNDDRGAQAFRLLLSAPDAIRNKLRGYGQSGKSIYKRLDVDMRNILDRDENEIINFLDGFAGLMQKVSDINYDAKYWTNDFSGHVGFLHAITPANPMNSTGTIFALPGITSGVDIWEGTTVSNCIPVPIYATPTFAAESCIRSACPFLKGGTHGYPNSYGQNVFYRIKFNPKETYNCAPVTTFGQPEILIPARSEFKVKSAIVGQLDGVNACVIVDLETQARELPTDSYSRWAWRDFVDGFPIPAIIGT